MNQASGTRIDSKGSNNLTDNNTVTSAAGKLGTSAVFDAVNSEYLSAADSASLTFPSGITISGWFKPTVGSVMHVISKGRTGIDGEGLSNFEFLIRYINWNNTLVFYAFGSQNTVVTSAQVVRFGKWNHFVAWRDPDTGKQGITVNCHSVTADISGSVAINNTTRDLEIGRGQEGSFYYYTTGQIGPVSIWSRALPSEERTALWNDGRGLEYSKYQNANCNQECVSTSATGSASVSAFESAPSATDSGGVQTRCCPNSIPTTLSSTISGTGNCACASGSASMTYDSTLKLWNQTSEVQPCAANDSLILTSYNLHCGIGDLWELQLTIGTDPQADPGEPCYPGELRTVNPISLNCDPFEAVFELVSFCCDNNSPGSSHGTLVITITE